MTDNLTLAGTYRGRLPKALREELERIPRGSKAKPPTVALVEAIAEEALKSGVTPKGPILIYVVRRLRAGLGLAGFPTPPDLGAGESAFIDRRVDDALTRLKAHPDARQPGSAPAPTTPPRTVNPDGYTDPDNVTDLATARANRQGPPPRVA